MSPENMTADRIPAQGAVVRDVRDGYAGIPALTLAKRLAATLPDSSEGAHRVRLIDFELGHAETVAVDFYDALVGEIGAALRERRGGRLNDDDQAQLARLAAERERAQFEAEVVIRKREARRAERVVAETEQRLADQRAALDERRAEFEAARQAYTRALVRLAIATPGSQPEAFWAGDRAPSSR